MNDLVALRASLEDIAAIEAHMDIMQAQLVDRFPHFHRRAGRDQGQGQANLTNDLGRLRANAAVLPQNGSIHIGKKMSNHGCLLASLCLLVLRLGKIILELVDGDF